MTTKTGESFLKHVIIYGIGTLLLQAGSFLLLPLYTFYLTKADYGTLDIISRVGQAINICLMVQGIRLATTNLYRKTKDIRKKQQVVATLLSMLIPILAIGFFFVCYFSEPIKTFLKIPTKEILILGILAVFLEAILSLPLTIIQARLESLAFVKVSIAQFLLRTCLIVINVVILKMGIKGVLVSDCIVLGLFGVVLISRELIIGTIKPDISKYKFILRFTLPFIPAASLGFFIQSADRFWLVKYAGLAEVGLFALAMNIINGGSSLVATPVMRVWQTKMYDIFESTDASNDVGTWYSRIFKIYLLAFFLIVVFRGEVITIVTPQSYHPAMLYVLPLAIANFAMSMANLFESTFYFYQKTYCKILINICTAITLGALLYFIVPIYGAMGTAICLVSGYAFHMLLTFLVAQKIFMIKMQLTNMFLTFMSAVIIGGVCEFIQITLYGFVLKCILVCSYLIWVILFSGLVCEDDKTFIKGSFYRAIIVLRNIRIRG